MTMTLGVLCVPVSHSMTVPDCVGCIGQREEARSPFVYVSVKFY